jgi:hypothetical protein
MGVRCLREVDLEVARELASAEDAVNKEYVDLPPQNGEET